MNMSTLNTFTRICILALALAAGVVFAATPGTAAKRQKVYVYVNKGAATYGDFRTPAGPRRMLIRDRLTGPRWGYIGPHYDSRFGPGYHTNGPGIGIER
jgi:hypothetical protein